MKLSKRSKHFTTAELHAELTRAAYVVGVHGPYTWGAHVATLQRFITHPHFQEEPVTAIPALKSTQVALYRASLIQAVMPAVRIEPRVTGYMAGYRANTDLTPEPTPEQVELYRRGLVEQFFGFQYCASAALGFRDGWALAVREAK